MARKNRIVELPPDVRLDIERQLVRGVSKASIVRQYGDYGVTKDNLLNYERGEFLGRQAAVWARKSENNVATVLDEMSTLMDQSRTILQEALDKNHNSLALKAVAQIRNNLELIGRIQHAIFQQQKEAVTIEVQDRHTQFSKDFQVALKSLPGEDHATYRAITIRALSKMGAIDKEDPEVGVDTTEGEIIGTTPLVQGQIQEIDQDQHSADEYRIDQSDHSLKPTRTTHKRRDLDSDGLPKMRRTTPRKG